MHAENGNTRAENLTAHRTTGVHTDSPSAVGGGWGAVPCRLWPHPARGPCVCPEDVATRLLSVSLIAGRRRRATYGSETERCRWAMSRGQCPCPQASVEIVSGGRIDYSGLCPSDATRNSRVCISGGRPTARPRDAQRPRWASRAGAANRRTTTTSTSTSAVPVAWLRPAPLRSLALLPRGAPGT